MWASSERKLIDRAPYNQRAPRDAPLLATALVSECESYAVRGELGGFGDRSPRVACGAGCSHGGVAVDEGLVSSGYRVADLVEVVGHS